VFEHAYLLLLIVTYLSFVFNINKMPHDVNGG